MPKLLSALLENNRRWAERMRATEPDFFEKLLGQQRPEYLWIGCSDSRVPANQIVGLLPGELFVHRNVANVVHQTDLNLLSVLQFAVETLGVKHVIVCGHYGCGGVRAAMEDEDHGLLENWIRTIKETYHRHGDELGALQSPAERVDRLCELNVREQVFNVCRTTVLQRAWREGREVIVHGWIYGIGDGLLRDVGPTVGREDADVWGELRGSA